MKDLRAIAINLLWVYLLYMICRVVFVLCNLTAFGDSFTSWAVTWRMLEGGFVFDSSAIFYTNAPYLVLALLPLHLKEREGFYRFLKWLYVGVNSICVFVNLADTVFFGFRGQRTTASFFHEFGNETNMASVAVPEIVKHWYLVLLLGVMIWSLWTVYQKPLPSRSLRNYYIQRSLTLVIVGLLAVSAMRGSWALDSTARPISINYAFRYAPSSTETGIVLNTPFSMIRTHGQGDLLKTPEYFSEEELDAIYSPVHIPDSTTQMRKKNVVVIIVESFAREFIGKFNQKLDGGAYKGYTPWTDQMIDSCMWFDEMVANTFFSIDAVPAVMASIPRAERSFVVSPYSVNAISSLASELGAWGYTTAFFHGAPNESLGIHAFTTQAGFQKYFGMNEFVADDRFGGKEEFDGTWGIWDEPFLQYFCAELSEMPQPFLAGVFTLSSHHPFKIPEQYRDTFPDEGEFEINKCVRYADMALGQFFESARRQPWFDNTIFVITADHTSSKRTHAEYKNLMGNFRIPILIYDPSGSLPRGRQDGIIQQIDLMPTLLNYLGYDKPHCL